MADSNKIVYGLSKCYYAKATIASDGSATYDTPVALPGARTLTLDAQGDTNIFWADNKDYYTSVANNGYEGDLELANIPESFLTDILGYTKDHNDILFEDANAPVVHFALLFQCEGDAHSRRHIFYNCTCTRPTVASNTKEDSIEPQTKTLSITATTVYNSDYNTDVVKASATPSETAAYNGWYTAVYMITST